MRPVDFITFGKTAGIGMMVPMACWLRTRCGKPFGPPQDYFRSHPAAAVLATWCHGLELRPSMWAGEPRGYRTRGEGLPHPWQTGCGRREKWHRHRALQTRNLEGGNYGNHLLGSSGGSWILLGHFWRTFQSNMFQPTADFGHFNIDFRN